MLVEVLFNNCDVFLFDTSHIEVNNDSIWFHDIAYPHMDSMIAKNITHIVICSRAMTSKEQDAIRVLQQSSIPISFIDLQGELSKVKRQLKKKNHAV